MGNILLSLASAVIVSVLCDTLISSKSMKKLSQLAIGITVSTILVIPIVNFVGDDSISEIPTITYNDNYINLLDNQYAEVIATVAEHALDEIGYKATVTLAISDGKICDVAVLCDCKLNQESAQTIGFAVCEILNIQLYNVVVKSQ